MKDEDSLSHYSRPTWRSCSQRRTRQDSKTTMMRLPLLLIFSLGLLQSLPDSFAWTTISRSFLSSLEGAYHLHHDKSTSYRHFTALFDTSDFSSTSRSATHHQNGSNATALFQIRPAKYADLGPASDIILDSFYVKKTAFRGLLKLAELNRIQQNFPHFQKEKHTMYVAVVPKNNIRRSTVSSPLPADEIIVGFVDVDLRPCKPEMNLPRPYLSDLCVHPSYRKQGIAQALVTQCQDFVLEQNDNDSISGNTGNGKRLYIRVEEDNIPALRMYQKMGYGSHAVETTKDQQNIITLVKIF